MSDMAGWLAEQIDDDEMHGADPRAIRAKRTILTLHGGRHDCVWADDLAAAYLDEYDGDCRTLRAVAGEYDDRSGWREQWRV